MIINLPLKLNRHFNYLHSIIHEYIPNLKSYLLPAFGAFLKNAYSEFHGMARYELTDVCFP